MATLQLIHAILILQTISIVTLYSTISRIHYEDHQPKKWCNGPLKFLDPPGPLTAVASFPGSGNTWTRYLIQQATGYATGCIYFDRSLQQGDFPGEGIFDGSVIAIKTHSSSSIPKYPGLPGKYEKVVLLIRDPYDTLLAEFNRRKSESHTGTANLEDFSTQNWFHFVEKQSREWHEFYKFYAENYSKENLHWVKYENLKLDLIQELKKLVQFLGQTWNWKIEECLESKKQGSAKRPKPSVDLKQFFTPAQVSVIENLKNETFFRLK